MPRAQSGLDPTTACWPEVGIPQLPGRSQPAKLPAERPLPHLSVDQGACRSAQHLLGRSSKRSHSAIPCVSSTPEASRDPTNAVYLAGAKLVRVTSSLGCVGKLMCLTAAAMHPAILPFEGVVVTLTPTACPF
jgi:hypothetical protein